LALQFTGKHQYTTQLVRRKLVTIGSHPRSSCGCEQAFEGPDRKICIGCARMKTKRRTHRPEIDVEVPLSEKTENVEDWQFVNTPTNPHRRPAIKHNRKTSLPTKQRLILIDARHNDSVGFSCAETGSQHQHHETQETGSRVLPAS
jgi:hypothetical protein